MTRTQLVVFRRSALRLLGICTAVLVVAFMSGCRNTTIPPGELDRSADFVATPATFVGSQKCSTCHMQETQLWSSSHHDLAMQSANSDTVLGNFNETTFTHFGVTSTFSKRNGEYFVRTEGQDGTLEQYPVAYTFGVDPLQQYLIEFPDGRLQALSIAWDSRPCDAGGQRWFHLYPDERITYDDPLHWTNHYQNWNFMCSECHSTNVDKNFIFDEDRYETTWSEIDVSCEACHGPASNHVAWAGAAAVTSEVNTDTSKGLTFGLKNAPAAWIIDIDTGLATRTPPREKRTEIETCARCHSRRSVVSDLYVHGQPLMDTHSPALLEDVLYHPDGQILDEVYVYGSFLQSKMYAEGVSCNDCHDPHSLQVRGTGNSVCSGCHLPDKFDTPDHYFHQVGSSGASCVNCHMPERNYMVIDGRRDHSLRVPRPDLSLVLGTPNACNSCHTEESVEWAMAAVTEWYGSNKTVASHYGEAIYAGRNGLSGAAQALRQLADDPDMPGIARASAISLLEGYFSAVDLPLLRRALNDDDPIVRAASVSASEVLPPPMRAELVVPLLYDPIRAVRLQAGRVLASVSTNVLSGSQVSKLNQVLDEYRASQLVNADRAEAHLNLGVLHTQLGEFDEAEQYYQTALSLDPSFLAGYLNLADLYRQLERDEEGEAVLREALAGTNDPAPVEHSLGLLLVRQKRLPEAIRALGRAAELRPEMARYAYVYAVALESVGDVESALSVLSDAHTRVPENRDLLIALVTMHRESGSHESAVEYARKLFALTPQDPAARQLLQQLESTQP